MELSSSYLVSLSRGLAVGAVLSLSAFGAVAEDLSTEAATDAKGAQPLPLVQVKHTGAQYIPVPHVEKEYVQVVIYRPQVEGGAQAGISDIYVNGELQSVLKAGEFSAFCLTPGRHAIESYLDDAPLYAGKAASQAEAQLAGGKTYFIEAGAEPGKGIPTPVKRIDAENRLLGYTHSPIVNRASSVKRCVYTGNMVSLGNVLFTFNGKSAADMEVGGQEVIGKMATYLKSLPQAARVNIVGHADPVGSPEGNRRLSLQRAETVKQLLTASGVSADALFPSGQGSSDPVVECKGKMSVAVRNACNRANRRVDVLIHAYNPAE